MPQPGKDRAIRLAARELIATPASALPEPRFAARPDVEFAVTLLKKIGDLPRSAVAGRNQLLTLPEVGERFASRSLDDIVRVPANITSQSELQNVAPGMFVVFLKPPSREARHLVVSIGGGWFAGAGNHVVRPSLGPGRSLITAEEFGPITRGLLDEQWSLVAGHPRWTNTRRVPVLSVAVPDRARDLLGVEVGHIQASGGRVTVRAHGAAFNVNGMDAIELGHLIKGQAEVQGMREAISDVHLLSCRSAQDAVRPNVSTGQVLADFLDAPVKAYRHEVTGFNRHLGGWTDGGPAGMKVFRSRLRDFDAAHPNPRPQQLAEREALVRRIEDDRKHHMFWHNLSTKFGWAVARAGAALNAVRQTRSVENDRAATTSLDRLLADIASFALDALSSEELLQRHNVPFSYALHQSLETIEEFRWNAVDADDCLGICLATISLRPQWLRLAGEPAEATMLISTVT
jgi:hypothetical protein